MENTISDQQLEQLQKKAKARFTLMAVCTGLVLVLSFIGLGWFMYYYTEISIIKRIAAVIVEPVAIAFFAAAIFYALFVHKAYKQFDLNFKNKYVLSTVWSTGLFKDLEYHPDNGLSYNDIRNGAVVGCGHEEHFHSEDLLTGKYQEIRFDYCDVITTKTVKSGKELRTIFQGQVMRFASFDTSKTSFGHLQIFEKEFLSNIQGWTAQHKVQVEDEVFNRRFQVFAADPHNAFYILTPRMLEQITKFADLAGEQIAISFCGPVMYVAIHRSRSMFNGHVNKPVKEQKQDILDDVQLLRKAGDLLILEMATMPG